MDWLWEVVTENPWVWVAVAVMVLAGPQYVAELSGYVIGLLRFCLNFVLSALSGGGRSVRETTLARASWGAVMIYAVVFEVDYFDLLPDGWQGLTQIGLGILGITWFLMGFGWRGRGDREGSLIQKYAVKIGVGAVLFYFLQEPPYDWLEEPIRLAMIWCLITGGVKLALVLRGFPAVPPVDPGMPHGGAKFSNPDDPGWKL